MHVTEARYGISVQHNRACHFQQKNARTIGNGDMLFSITSVPFARNLLDFSTTQRLSTARFKLVATKRVKEYHAITISTSSGAVAKFELSI
jgi:hypothetical protein